MRTVSSKNAELGSLSEGTKMTASVLPIRRNNRSSVVSCTHWVNVFSPFPPLRTEAPLRASLPLLKHITAAGQQGKSIALTISSVSLSN